MPVLVIGIVAAWVNTRCRLDSNGLSARKYLHMFGLLVIRAGVRLKQLAEASDRSGDCALKRIHACPRSVTGNSGGSL